MRHTVKLVLTFELATPSGRAYLSIDAPQWGCYLCLCKLNLTCDVEIVSIHEFSSVLHLFITDNTTYVGLEAYFIVINSSQRTTTPNACLELDVLKLIYNSM